MSVFLCLTLNILDISLNLFFVHSTYSIEIAYYVQTYVYISICYTQVCTLFILNYFHVPLELC